MIILASPLSNQNVRADIRTLERAGMLSVFCTTIAWRHDGALFRMLPRAIRAEMKRRTFDGVDGSRIKSFPAREMIRLVAGRVGPSALTRQETGWASVDGVLRDFDNRVARMIREAKVKAAAVYAYEDAALHAFEAAAEAGMRRFYELPIGYWRVGLRILAEEAERNPEWAATMEILCDSAEKREHKDAELLAADHVIVPSDFVRHTLREHPGIGATIDIIPYGAPTVPEPAASAPISAPKLRLLYVGNLTQMKGISYLFEAMHRLKGIASLTLVGTKSGADCPALNKALAHHNWLGGLRHERVLEIMAQHDVLIFPSLFDGFGLVILEAMSRGLPVITTPNAGAAVAIDDGENGFLVPIRDPDAIADRVARLAEDRDRLASMRSAALRKAELMSWAVRETTLIRTLRARMGLNGA